MALEEDHHTTLSRLSICHSSESVKNESDLGILMSELSLESFDGEEADGEGSDEANSDGDSSDFHSLPAVSLSSRRRKKIRVSGESGSKCNIRRKRRVIREKKSLTEINEFNGESEGGNGMGLTVLTKAKGGNKSLRMDLGEVKACRDLGFELEDPGRVLISTGSGFDTQTSSGGDSPIATWRISSPGDDPKQVKARLKVWAQAVALASTSRQAS